MKNILFLTSTYLPDAGANGLITHSIIKTLIQRGYCITVISVKSNTNEKEYEVIEGIEVFRVEKTNFTLALENINNSNKITKKIFFIFNLFFRRIKNILFLYKFPDFDPIQRKQIIKTANKIISNKQINSVIAVNKPYSNIGALTKIKKGNKNINSIGLFLDSLESIKRPFFLPKSIYKILISSRYAKLDTLLDKLFLPVNLRDINEKLSSNIKPLFFEFPSLDFKSRKTNREKKECSEILYFTYAGTLDTNYRNPKIFLTSLNKMLLDGYFIEIDLYGKNNTKEIFNEFINLSINNHGYTTKEKIYTSYHYADFLVNVSNKKIDSVPSKIFELFSTGKPIINYVKSPNDYSLKYFKKYPLAFNFYEWENFDIQLSELKKFILETRNCTIKQEEIRNIYVENTSDFFVNKLEMFL